MRRESDKFFSVVVLLAIFVGLPVLYISKKTGISPEAIMSTALRLIVLVVAVVATILIWDMSLGKWWSCILAAAWLCFTPILNDMGAGYTEKGFGYIQHVVEPRWYVDSFWQLTVAAVLASLEPARTWGWEKYLESR